MYACVLSNVIWCMPWVRARWRGKGFFQLGLPNHNSGEIRVGIRAESMGGTLLPSWPSGLLSQLFLCSCTGIVSVTMGRVLLYRASVMAVSQTRPQMLWSRQSLSEVPSSRWTLGRISLDNVCGPGLSMHMDVMILLSAYVSGKLFCHHLKGQPWWCHRWRNQEK